jgi:hypothetical protein
MRFFAVFFVTAVSFFNYSFAQTKLNPGDIAIIGFNFKDPDQFSFLLFADVSKSTEIHFTDCGWKSGGGFRVNEGIVTYKAPANLKAGSIITFPDDSGFTRKGVDGFFGLTVDGDQILIFQNDTTNPEFLFAVNSNSTGGWDAEAASNNTSTLPPGLVDGGTAIALKSYVNGYYDCILFHKSEVILDAIVHTANWQKSASHIDLPQECSFILPLGLIAFDAEQTGDNAQINFSIENVERYESAFIEKKTEQEEFSVIASIGQRDLKYQNKFTDINFYSSAYYRLRLSGESGEQISDPVFLNKKTTQIEAPLVYIHEDIARIINPVSQFAEYRLYSSTGVLLSSVSADEKDIYRLEDKLKTLGPGTYFISYISDEISGRVKFVK